VLLRLFRNGALGWVFRGAEGRDQGLESKLLPLSGRRVISKDEAIILWEKLNNEFKFKPGTDITGEWIIIPGDTKKCIIKRLPGVKNKRK